MLEWIHDIISLPIVFISIQSLDDYLIINSVIKYGILYSETRADDGAPPRPDSTRALTGLLHHPLLLLPPHQLALRT